MAYVPAPHSSHASPPRVFLKVLGPQLTHWLPVCPGLQIQSAVSVDASPDAEDPGHASHREAEPREYVFTGQGLHASDPGLFL